MSTHRETVVGAGLGARSSLGLIFVGLVIVSLIAIVTNQARSSGPSDPVDAPAGANSGTAASQAPPDQDPDVRDVESAQGAAVDALVERYGTTECFMVASRLRHIPTDYADILDQLIADAQIGSEGWVDDRRIWVGSTLAGAAEAFGATEAFTDDHDSAWVLRETKSGYRAYELLQFESRSGRSTWQLGDEVAKCDSTDPASDDDEAAG